MQRVGEALFSLEPRTPGENSGVIGVTPPSRPGVARAAPVFGAVPGASSAIGSLPELRILV